MRGKRKAADSCVNKRQASCFANAGTKIGRPVVRAHPRLLQLVAVLPFGLLKGICFLAHPRPSHRSDRDGGGARIQPRRLRGRASDHPGRVAARHGDLGKETARGCQNQQEKVKQKVVVVHWEVESYVYESLFLLQTYTDPIGSTFPSSG